MSINFQGPPPYSPREVDELPLDQLRDAIKDFTEKYDIRQGTVAKQARVNQSQISLWFRDKLAVHNPTRSIQLLLERLRTWFRSRMEIGKRTEAKRQARNSKKQQLELKQQEEREATEEKEAFINLARLQEVTGPEEEEDEDGNPLWWAQRPPVPSSVLNSVDPLSAKWESKLKSIIPPSGKRSAAEATAHMVTGKRRRVERLEPETKHVCVVEERPAVSRLMGRFVPIRIFFELESSAVQEFVVWDRRDNDITPDMFASQTVEDLGLPLHAKDAIASQVRAQMKWFPGSYAPVPVSVEAMEHLANRGNRDVVLPPKPKPQASAVLSSASTTTSATSTTSATTTTSTSATTIASTDTGASVGAATSTAAATPAGGGASTPVTTSTAVPALATEVPLSNGAPATAVAAVTTSSGALHAAMSASASSAAATTVTATTPAAIASTAGPSLAASVSCSSSSMPSTAAPEAPKTEATEATAQRKPSSRPPIDLAAIKEKSLEGLSERQRRWASMFEVSDPVTPSPAMERLHKFSLHVRYGNLLYVDAFEWDINCPTNSVEDFVYQTCADMGLPSEMQPMMLVEVLQQLQQYQVAALLRCGVAVQHAGEDGGLVPGTEEHFSQNQLHRVKVRMCPPVTTATALRGREVLSSFTPKVSYIAPSEFQAVVDSEFTHLHVAATRAKRVLRPANKPQAASSAASATSPGPRTAPTHLARALIPSFGGGSAASTPYPPRYREAGARLLGDGMLHPFSYPELRLARLQKEIEQVSREVKGTPVQLLLEDRKFVRGSLSSGVHLVSAKEEHQRGTIPRGSIPSIGIGKRWGEAIASSYRAAEAEMYGERSTSSNPSVDLLDDDQIMGIHHAERPEDLERSKGKGRRRRFWRGVEKMYRYLRDANEVSQVEKGKDVFGAPMGVGYLDGGV